MEFLPATSLSLLERFSQLPPQFDGTFLPWDDQEASKDFKMILGNFLKFTTCKISLPRLLPSWFTLVRIHFYAINEFPRNWTPFLQLIEDCNMPDAGIFYQELLRRHREFCVPFGVKDFIFSLEEFKSSNLSCRIKCSAFFFVVA